jgi:hypothetical protein
MKEFFAGFVGAILGALYASGWWAWSIFPILKGLIVFLLFGGLFALIFLIYMVIEWEE